MRDDVRIPGRLTASQPMMGPDLSDAASRPGGQTDAGGRVASSQRTPLEQAKEATDLAREAFACGDMVTGIAAITLAAQLVQLARIWERADAK